METDIRRRAAVNGTRGTRSPRSKARNESALAKNPENFFQLALQILNSVGRFRKVLIAILIVAGACFAAWSQIPEQGKVLLVNRVLHRDQPPLAGFYPSVEIEETTLRYDLTEWTAVPNGGDRNQFCKVTTNESLTARRIQKSARYLARRAATTGPLPSFHSQTHHVFIQVSGDNRVGGPRMTDYDVLLDIGAEPLGRPFRAHLRSVRMGSFSDPHHEWAATTVLQPTGKVTVEVVFPKWKVGKNFHFSSSDIGDGSNYVEVPDVTTEVNENSIKWTIERPKLGFTYRIDWDW